jgi:predicted nucleic acid-binding protein
MKVFFDTNILVYLFDAGSPAKQRRARDLLARHTRAGETLLSTQVLQEFYVAVTRKLSAPLPPEFAFEALRELAVMPVVRVDTPLILSAAKSARERQLSFWDALVVQAAIEGGATRLYSEDMQDGQQFESVTIENPLRSEV